MRISDWSSDVCSSDLDRSLSDGGVPALDVGWCRRHRLPIASASHLPERDVGVDRGLLRQAEDPLADDVVLDLRRSRRRWTARARRGHLGDDPSLQRPPPGVGGEAGQVRSEPLLGSLNSWRQVSRQVAMARSSGRCSSGAPCSSRAGAASDTRRTERRVRWWSWSARSARHPGASIRSREPCGAAAPAAMLGGTHECHPAPCTSTGDTYMKVDYPIISADSHITEAPNTYTDFIDPAWRDRAPHLVDGGDQMGDM